MSLRNNLKSSRNIIMRDSSCPKIPTGFNQNLQLWIAEFLTIQQYSDEMDELEALLDFVTSFPDFEIDTSFFEWCTSVQLFTVTYNEIGLSEKGSVFLEFIKQSQFVVA